MSIAPNDTHAVVITALTDLTLAIGAGSWGDFALAELIELRDALNIVAVQNFPEEEYNQKATFLLGAMLELIEARHRERGAQCPVALKMQTAIAALARCSKVK